MAGDLPVVAVAVEGVIADAFVAAQLLVVGGRGQRQVVDPGLRRRLGLGVLGPGFGVGVAEDGVRQRFAETLVAVAGSTVSKSNGGNTSSTRRPTSAASTW